MQFTKGREGEREDIPSPHLPVSSSPSLTLVLSSRLVRGTRFASNAAIAPITVPDFDVLGVNLLLAQEPLTVIALIREGSKLQEFLAEALASGPIIEWKDVPGHGLRFSVDKHIFTAA